MIDEVTKSGRPPSHMIWAAIGYNTRSDLIFMERRGPKNGYTSESYCESLEEGLLPIYEAGCPFQQDNAAIHKSGPTRQWFEEHGIWVIDWPPYSPDLNPIEHVWGKLKKHLFQQYPELALLGQSEVDILRMKDIARNAWHELPQDYFRALIDSMPRRITAVIEAKGWHTKY